jgi:hypothetical protein
MKQVSTHRILFLYCSTVLIIIVFIVNAIDKELFLNFMLAEVIKLKNKDVVYLLKYSPIYRIKRLYDYQQRLNKSKNYNNFYQFLKYLYLELGWKSLYMDTNHTINELPNTENIINVLDLGEYAYIYDLKWIFEFLKHFGNDITIFDRALILGTQFSARGIDYRNDDNCNDISYSINVQPSCWCRIFYMGEEDRKYTKGDVDINSQYDNHVSLGQLNAFFVLNFPFEPILDGIPIASINMWNGSKPRFGVDEFKDKNGKITKSNYYFESLIQIDIEKDIFDHNIRFVPLYNVYPNPLAILTLDKEDNPIKLEAVNRKRHKNIPQNNVNRIIFFPLQRNLECFIKNETIRLRFHPYGQTNRNVLDEIKAQVKI